MRTNKQKLVLLSIEDDKVFLTHRTELTNIKVDVTTVFNFGMFIQRVTERPNDEDVQKYIDDHF